MGPHLEAIWSAGKDAVRHGRTVVRVGIWDLQAKARAKIARALVSVVAAIGVAAALVTLAVWGTVSTLRELSSLLGGGLLGCLGATASVAVTFALVVACYRFYRNRQRVKALRHALHPEQNPEPKPASPEEAEIERMRTQAMAAVAVDKDKITQHASAIIDRRPLTALGLAAGSGLVTSRLLMAMPRGVRRSVIGVLRTFQSAGIAGLLGSLAGGRSDS